MGRKIAAGIAGLLFVAGVVVFIWARSVFAGDAMRNTLAAQISAAIGQPVTIGTISAGLYPRVTVLLGDVAIGQPPGIHARTLRLGTDLRALLSRRIVGGTVRLDGASLTLPLPPFTIDSAPVASSGGGSSLPVEIVSIDEIILNDVEILSGGRTLRGQVEAVPRGRGLEVRRVSLTAEGTSIEAAGELTDLAGPVGHLDVRAGTLDLARLLTFMTEFSQGSGLTERGGASRAAASTGPGPDVTLTLTADRATMGGVSFEKLTGTARATGDAVVVDPMAFGLFGGQYQGSVTASVTDSPTFRWRAALSNVDVAAVMAFAGSPGVITGRLTGRVDVTSGGDETSRIVDNARGTARVDITDGVVKNLGLVASIVVATSMRADASVPGRTGDERFTRLGASLAIANGTARTSDLLFESPDVSLRAAGSVRLDGSAIDLRGDIQLSDALSKQAGRDLVRYTQEQGRVTVPAAVTGSAAAPVARVDLTQLATRAAKNRIEEEATKAIDKALGTIFKR